MSIYFERDIYQKMLKWKENREKSSIPQSLEISGPRQCGKTTVIDKFTRENYKNVVNIHLGKIRDLTIVRNWENRIKTYVPDDIVTDFLRLFSPDFIDSSTTVIVIDEIQESHQVYQMIRQVTREFKSHLIVSGSYLGRVIRSENFAIPAGDLYKLKMTTLTFEEFLGIFDKRKVWESLDLFGNSIREDYDEIMKLFNNYLYLGGYPAVILAYLEEGDELRIDSMLLGLIETFTEESTKYLENAADKNIFGALFEGVAYLLVNEKRGTFYLTDELDRIVQEKHKSRYSRQSIINVSDWLVTSGVLSQCNLANDCNINSIRFDARLYFTDIGVARLFLERANISPDALSGFLTENFVFLCLQRMLSEQKLFPKVPAFGMYGNGEIDFVVKSKSNGIKYAVEVKSGKNKSKTVDVLLNNGIVNKVLFAKGNTYGGVDGNKITIPISLFSRYNFNNTIISPPVIRKMTAFD
jgi:predicted AAA+ superfamily ATPase